MKKGRYRAESGLAFDPRVSRILRHRHAPDWLAGNQKTGSVLSSTNIVGATWEIRQGISEGNGGTIIASGMTATPNVTPTGRDGFGFIEQMVEVDALDVFLPGGITS